jgi:cell division protease FtsH
MKKNKKILQILIIVLALIALAFLFIPEDFYQKILNPESEAYTYKEFYEMAGENKISSVVIKEKKIKFSLTENPGNFYFVENPSSPSLKEYLLLNNVSVKEEASAESIISLIFDIFFYLFFFGIIIIAFRKFISPNTFKVVHKTGVKFDDIVGMDNLKRDMKQVMQIMKAPEEYAKRGVRMPKGILLEGEPGNGKTLFAKALAGEANVNFIPAKATDFESMFMAIGPLKVKLLFKKARAKAPCIVFIDEFDGIGTVRNYSGTAIETENTRIVTALLNELDGFEPSNGVLVLAATNSIHALDPALIRPGRFDAKFSVPYPGSEERKALVRMYCRKKAYDDEVSESLLAKMFEGYSCAKIEACLNRAALLSSQEGREKFNLEDVRQACREL